MGSTFAFHVRALAAEPGRAVQVYPDDEAPLRPLRVLLAEDHSTNQYLIRAYLRSGKHVVTVAETGIEAVEAVRSGDFDVVLMDMQMPVLDGLNATRQIRALGGAAAALPIIALTANAMPEDRAACLGAGMSDYLSKPVEAAALLAALRRACGGAEVELETARRSAAGA
jgi:CheY-like chemotaxis protein